MDKKSIDTFNSNEEEEIKTLCNDNDECNKESSNNDDDNDEEEIFQCVEVDLNNRRMDPLERTARKMIPIPKKYYWDTQIEAKTLSFKTKAWHNTVYGLGKLLHISESVGGVAASVLGLNESRYAYVTDTMTEEEWEEARRINKERRKQRAARRKQIESTNERSEALGDAGISHDAM